MDPLTIFLKARYYEEAQRISETSGDRVKINDLRVKRDIVVAIDQVLTSSLFDEHVSELCMLALRAMAQEYKTHPHHKPEWLIEGKTHAA